MEGLEPTLRGGLQREDGLPRAKPLAGLWVPRPDTTRVRIDKLKNLKVRSLVQPQVVAEVLLIERLVDPFGDDLKPFKEVGVPFAWPKHDSGSNATVVLIDDEVSDWLLETYDYDFGRRGGSCDADGEGKWRQIALGRDMHHRAPEALYVL